MYHLSSSSSFQALWSNPSFTCGASNFSNSPLVEVEHPTTSSHLYVLTVATAAPVVGQYPVPAVLSIQAGCITLQTG